MTTFDKAELAMFGLFYGYAMLILVSAYVGLVARFGPGYHPAFERVKVLASGVPYWVERVSPRATDPAGFMRACWKVYGTGREEPDR